MTEFDTIHVAPAARAGLSFHYAKPRNWRVLEIPKEEPRFDNPEHMMALHVCMAPYGALVFSVAARPAYADGAVSQWMTWLCGKQGIAIDEPRRVTFGAAEAMECMGRQESEAGPMRMRILFLEDGQRLFTVTCMAPEEIWTGSEGLFASMVASLQLDAVHGPSAALEPAAGREPAGARACDVALAADAGSLDFEHPLNLRLRKNGLGLTPRVLSVNLEEKHAVVAGAAVEGVFQVPLGWHVIDDGRRTLVFDAGGRIQVNLDLRGLPAEGLHGLMEAIEREHEEQQPGIAHVHFHAAGFEGLAFRGLRVGEESLEQAFLLRNAHREEVALVARVTAKESDMTLAMSLAEVMLLSLGGGKD
ncbi:MAG: hypothetical protein JNK48_25765 [Bryobacterales bacterium]|nr:hypothetical protein [Bryobacterales bacterium]